MTETRTQREARQIHQVNNKRKYKFKKRRKTRARGKQNRIGASEASNDNGALASTTTHGIGFR